MGRLPYLSIRSPCGSAVDQLNVVSSCGPVADFAGFVAVGLPEGDLFDHGVFEVAEEVLVDAVRSTGSR